MKTPLLILAAAAVLVYRNWDAIACTFTGCTEGQRDHVHQVLRCRRCGDPISTYLSPYFIVDADGTGLLARQVYDRASGRSRRTAV